MKRFRWYRANWGITIGTLVAGLKRHGLRADDDDDGFVLEELRSDYLTASFYEKRIIEEELVSPFGVRTSSHRTEYIRTIFQAEVTAGTLEVVDAPKSSHAFVNSLMSATDFKASFSDIHADVRAWVDTFQQIARLAGTVDLVQLGNVALENGSVGRIVAKGGAADIAASSLVGGRSSVIERMQLRIAGQSGKIVFNRSGGVSVEGVDLNTTLQPIRDSLWQQLG